MAIAYDIKFLKDGPALHTTEERAELLLHLSGPNFRVTKHEEYYGEGQASSYGSRRKRKAEQKRRAIRDDFVFFLHLYAGQEEVQLYMVLDSLVWLEHSKQWEEPGCFSVLRFGTMKHILYHHRDFDERYGAALVDFMVAASRAFGADRSYLYDDYNMFWRLNAHAIYYHPIEEYRRDLQRLRNDWQHRPTYLGQNTEWTDADFPRDCGPDEVKEIEHRLDHLAAQGNIDLPLSTRLHDVDYVLDEVTDTLVLRGFPGPATGYVMPFFLPEAPEAKETAGESEGPEV